MSKYEFTEKQVENLKALILDANIKGAVAPVIVELLGVLAHPVGKDCSNDLHSEHNDTGEKVEDKP